MPSPKMMTLLICVGCLVSAFDVLSLYELSYMQISAMLSFVVLFICIIFFYDHLFSCVWGCITAIVVFIPAFLALFEQTTNYKAVAIDGILSLVLLVFFGLRLLKKIKLRKLN